MSKAKIDASKLRLPGKAATGNVKKTPPTAGKADQAVNKVHTPMPQAPANTEDKEETVRFTLDIPKTLHREMKMRVLSLPTEPSLKDYILDLVRKDLPKK